MSSGYAGSTQDFVAFTWTGVLRHRAQVDYKYNQNGNNRMDSGHSTPIAYRLDDVPGFSESAVHAAECTVPPLLCICRPSFGYPGTSGKAAMVTWRTGHTCGSTRIYTNMQEIKQAQYPAPTVASRATGNESCNMGVEEETHKNRAVALAVLLALVNHAVKASGHTRAPRTIETGTERSAQGRQQQRDSREKQGIDRVFLEETEKSLGENQGHKAEEAELDTY
ncbi:hypothetical protein B0H19DRAFT_1239219 [Mycena capillaripes]|nr:hypothetical protein B0H19DRAFT_1239219 [Mycena capillaripes]